MTRFLKASLILIVFLFMALMGGGSQALADQSKVVLVGGGQAYKPLDDFVLESESVTIAGDSWYVDSGKSASGDGKSWDYAFITLDEAINAASADNGDVIHVAVGHAETITTAAIVVPDKDGLTAIGYGEGAQRPTFSWADDTDATIPVSAADFVVKNMIFDGSSTSSDTPDDMFYVTAAGFQLIGSKIVTGDSTEAATLVITGDADADRMKVIGCEFTGSTDTGTTAAISFSAGATDIEIAYCVFKGDYSSAAIYSASAVLEVNIHHNYVYNFQDDDHAIELSSNTSTGVIAYNHVVTDAYATAIDSGGLDVIETYWSNDEQDDVMATPVWTHEDGAVVWSATERAVLESEANDALVDEVLDRFMALADGTGAAPASVVEDSILAKIMGDDTTAVATTFDNTTDSLEALGNEVEGINYLVKIGTGTAAYPAQVTAESVIAYIMAVDAAITDYDEGTMSLEALNIDLDAILADSVTISGGTLPVSPTSGSLADFISGASGSSTLGTNLGTDKSIIDAIGTDGVAVLDVKEGLAGMIGVDDADNDMATTAVLENNDGSLFERLEHLQALSDDILAGLRMTGTDIGNVFYVDDAIGNTSYTGTSWVTAKALIVEGYNLTQDDKGDIVFVAPDHEEPLAAAQIALDEAGVMIIGLGTSEQMPMITMSDATSSIDVTATDVTIENIHFYSTTADSTLGIDVDASGFTLRGCKFTGTAAGHVITVDLATTLSDIVIEDNYVYILDTDGTSFLSAAAGAITNLVIRNNRIWGDYDDAVIYSDQTNLNIHIEGNTLRNVLAGQHAIELKTGATTGLIFDNVLAGSVPGQILDPGSCLAYRNEIVESDVTNANDMGMMQDKWYYATKTFELDATATFDALFTVTGTVEVKAYGTVTETLTSHADTVSFGSTDSAALIIAATGGDAPMSNGDTWTSATTAKSAASPTGFIVDDDNLGITQSGTNLTDGTIVFHVYWRPLEELASIVPL